jgi:putative addiction module component (TIGR02574 family)
VTKPAEELLKRALELDLDERAELAAELLASLDGAADANTEAAWTAEIERRATRARSGEDPGTPWLESRERMKRSLPSR